MSGEAEETCTEPAELHQASTTSCASSSSYSSSSVQRNAADAERNFGDSNPKVTSSAASMKGGSLNNNAGRVDAVYRLSKLKEKLDKFVVYAGATSAVHPASSSSCTSCGPSSSSFSSCSTGSDSSCPSSLSAPPGGPPAGRGVGFRDTDDSDSSSVAALRDILQQLLDFGEINKLLLSRTKVAVPVAHLRKHPDATVRLISSRIVTRWRTLVQTDVAAAAASSRTAPFIRSADHDISSSSSKSTVVDIQDDANASSAGAHQIAPSAASPPSQSSQSSQSSSSATSLSASDCSSLSGPQSEKQGPFPHDFETSAASTGGDVSLGQQAALSAAKGGDPMLPLFCSATAVSSRRPLAEQEFVGPFCGDASRDKARAFLWRAFVSGVPSSQSDLMDLDRSCRICALIEEALHQAYPFKTREYNLQLKTIKFNLGDAKNPDFNLKLYVGSVTPQEVAVMPSKDMASEAKKKEREKEHQESMEACQADWNLRNMKSREGQFSCGKCKSLSTVYFQMQTRSADEPMTTFVTCLECGHRYKF